MKNEASSKIQFNDTVDPIGIELILEILSLSVSIVGVVHQIGWLSKRDKKIQQKFIKLREQTLRLHNNLDNLILKFKEYNEMYYNRNTSFSRKLTISDTLFILKEKDYLEWLDLQKSIHGLSKECYSLIFKIRELSLNYPNSLINETLNKEIFMPFDELLIKFSSYEFIEFATQLRNALTKLESILDDLTRIHDIRDFR